MVFTRYIHEYIRQFNNTDRKVWNYEESCVLTGAQYLYEATGEEIYLDCIVNFYDRYIEADGNILHYDKDEYSLDKVPSARPLFLLHQKTGEARYLAAIEIIAGQLRKQPRTKCGNYWHKGIYPNQIWLDGLYMAQPFCVDYERYFGKSDGYTDMVNQFMNVRKLLFDEEKHLYYHCYDETKTMFWADKRNGRSPNFWSRAMGWHIMSMIDCYSLLPQSRQDERVVLADLFREAVEGILEYQDKPTGLLYQLTALPEEEGNYLETSASVMLAYSLLKGSRLGLLDEQHGHNGEMILISIAVNKLRLKDSRLSLIDICPGTGLGPEGNLRRDGSESYYLSEKPLVDEQKGAGALMMAYGEYLKYRMLKKLKERSHRQSTCQRNAASINAVRWPERNVQKAYRHLKK